MTQALILVLIKMLSLVIVYVKLVFTSEQKVTVITPFTHLPSSLPLLLPSLLPLPLSSALPLPLVAPPLVAPPLVAPPLVVLPSVAPPRTSKAINVQT